MLICAFINNVNASFHPRAPARARACLEAHPIDSHTTSYWSDIMRKLRAKTRCQQCGFALEVDRHARGRWKIDPELWAERCTERASAPLSPFDCPHLKAATAPAARRDTTV